MTISSRPLAILLGTLLALSVAPAAAQSDGDGPPAPVDIGSALETLAAGIDPSDENAPVDPSDPDAPVDPQGPPSGEDIDAGDIDPSDPESVPGDPETPAEPAAPDEPSEPDGIDVPEPAEPEEGGFAEIFLAPDPAPKAGTWKVNNKRGTVVCTNVGTLPLKASTQTGRITLRNDGKKLRGKSIFQDQTKPVNMTWDPESNLYRGKIRLAAAGGRVNMDFTLRVVNPRRMVGSLSAKVTVNQGGVSGRCTVNRGLALKRTGD